jgi:hypothetical protein
VYRPVVVEDGGGNHPGQQHGDERHDLAVPPATPHSGVLAHDVPFCDRTT